MTNPIIGLFELLSIMPPHSKAMLCGKHVFLDFFRKVGWLQTFVYILCFSFFSVHLVHLLQNAVKPSQTHTYVEEVPFREMDFPVDIQICVNPAMNKTALKELGYNDGAFDYITGKTSRSNSSGHSMVGWGGRGQDNKSFLSAKEVFDAVKLSFEDIIALKTNETWIMYRTYEGNHIESPISATTFVKINRVHACRVLTMDNMELKPHVQNLAGAKTLFLNFGGAGQKGQNSKIEVKLHGRGLLLHRDQQRQRFASFGDDIEIVDKKLSRYVIKLKKNVFAENLPTQSCRNYPTPEFDSYRECDDVYLRRRIEEIAPGLNLTPIWMTGDIDQVTSQPLPIHKHVTGNTFN